MRKQFAQIKTLLSNKRLSKAKFNPQSNDKIPEQRPTQRNSIKRSESSSDLKKKQSNELLVIQQRFQQLEQNYNTILQQTRAKTSLFKKQQVQLQKFQSQSLKDKKQIERLRMMLGFIKKEDYGVQVDACVQSLQKEDKDQANTSTCSKPEQSIDSEFRSTNNDWHQTCKKRQCQKKLKIKAQSRLLSIKSEKTIGLGSTLFQSSAKSKYKFVPTLTFN